MGNLEDMFDKLGKKQIEDEKEKELEIDDTVEAELEIEEEIDNTVEAELEIEEEEEEIIIGSTEDDTDDDKEIKEEEFLAYASKKLGREIKSLSDLTTSEKSEVELSEQVAKINEFVKTTGRDVRDWFKIDSMNVDKMDNESLVKANMKLKYPELTDSQINRRFDKLYKLDAEVHDQDAIEDSQIELAIAATEAKQVLGEMNRQFAAPIPRSQEEVTVEQAAEFERLKRAYVEDMSKAVDAIGMFEFDIDGTKVKYKPSKEDIAEIKKANQNLETFFDEFKDETGKFNFEALAMMQFFKKKENVARLVKAVRGRYISEGKDAEIQKRKNTNLPSGGGGAAPEDTDKIAVKTKFTETLMKEIGGKPRQRIRL